MTEQTENPTAQATEAALAERDATIERLERMLADERQKAAALRSSAEGLQFKLDVLERSYAKQLADARELTAAVETELAAERAKLETLQAAHDEIARSLAQAQRDLERSEGARRQRPVQPPSPERPQPAAPVAALRSMEAEADTGEGTINTLLGAATWREQRTGPDSHLEARVHAADQDGPAEEMLAPELVFTRKDDDDER